MATVKVVNRGQSMKKEIISDHINTIMDLKRKLCEDNPDSVLLTFKGKLLNDSTPISTLGDEVEFVIEKEIEFSDIFVEEIPPKKEDDKCIRGIINGKSVVLDKSEVFYKNGKPFYITKKIKKIKLKDLIEFCKKNIGRAQLIQLGILSFIIATKNYPLLVMILTVNLLKMLSSCILKYKIDEKLKTHISFSIFMFVTSMLAIDHEKISRKVRKHRT